MVNKKIFLPLVVGLCFLRMALPQAEKKMSARDLFLSGSESKSTTKSDQTIPTKSDKTIKVPLGLRYSILKQKDDVVVEVDPDSVFYSGDRIRLSIQANDAGHLYIVVRGSSGKWDLLFPSKDILDGRNNIEKGGRYEIPLANTWFRFDKQPGTEKLFIVLSRQPEPDMEKLIQSLRQDQKAPTRPELADKSKGGSVEVVPSIDDALVSQIRGRVASRDLVLEKVNEEKPGEKAEKAVYVVNTTGSDHSRVVVDVSLNHR